MKNFFTLLLVAVSLYGKGQFPEVSIRGSEVRKITSAIVAGQEYQLQIMLPAGYKTSNKKYPVLYLMDSQWDFPLLNSLYGQQYFDGFIPEMMVVGITWGGTNPNPDSLRARDYTPTTEKRAPQSGGAAAFLSFIQKEVFPFIEANYKADPHDRALMGCSLGGLFTMYALFTQPGLFQRYVAASPAFGWDNEVLYQYEKKYFDNGANPPAKLFMCIGGVERSVPGFNKLSQHLSARHYPSLQIQSRVLENTGHSGTKGEGYARGLQYVFAKPVIHPTAAVLKKYVGPYQLADSTKIEIKLENNQLALYASPTYKYLLQATSEDSFFSTAEFMNIRFINRQGTITGFELGSYGNTQIVNKLK